MNIYYMRDNHTFRNLGTDVNAARLAISEEFMDGYTYGMLCTKDVPIKSVHAHGDLGLFLEEVDNFYSEVRSLNIGAGI